MDLVEMLLKQFGGDTLAKLSGLVGGGAGDVEKAIKAAIPTLLATLAGLVSSPAGTDKVVNALKSADTDGFDLDSILKGGAGKSDEVAKKGTSILEGLLGKGGLAALLPLLGKILGNKDVIAKLLPMIAPIVLSMISKQMKSSGLDIGGLAKILLGQKNKILGSMPAGLGDALQGVQGLGDVGKLAESAVSSAKTAAGEAASPLGKLLPVAILLAAVALGAWFLLGGGGKEKDKDGKTPAGGGASAIDDLAKKGADALKDAKEKAADTAADVAEKAGDLLGEAGEKAMGGVKSFFTDITGALDEVKDEATATAALPKIQDLHTSLESLLGGVKGLPEAAQPLISDFVKTAETALKGKIETILGLPGVSEILKPILDKVTVTLGEYLKK